MNYDSDIMRIVDEIQKDIDWRQVNEYNTTKLERWRDRLVKISEQNQAEREDFARREIAWNKELAEVKEDQYKCRVILTYLRGEVAASTHLFFSRLTNEMDRRWLKNLVQDHQAEMMAEGVPKRINFHE